MIPRFRTPVISCQVLIPNKKCPRTREVFLHEGSDGHDHARAENLAHARA